MALISYVDILEVVGELKDFKAKLVEGEEIAQKGGITELCVNDKKATGVDISASCQSVEEGELPPFQVSISVVSEPRTLKCKCSCLDGKSDKCQHVVATLIHLHRNNICGNSSKSFEVKTERSIGYKNNIECGSSENLSVSSGNETGSNNTHNAVVAVFLNNEATMETVKFERGQDGINSSESNLPYKLKLKSLKSGSCVVSKVDGCSQKTTAMETDASNSPCMNAEPLDVRSNSNVIFYGVNNQSECATPTELNSEPRMGRGQRKATPNPKYISDSPKFLCPVCSKSFGKKAHFEEHLRSHTGEKPFVCGVCGQRYSQKRSLLKHKEEGGDMGCRSQFKFKCEISDAVFDQQAQLDDRSLCHTGERVYPCSECDKSFTYQRGLDMHMRVHARAKMVMNEQNREPDKFDFMCDVCGKGFKKLINLTQHKYTHDEVKPFKCLECGKGFSRQRTLDAHKHDNNNVVSKPTAPASRSRSVIKCKTCGKEFTNRMHHEEHVRSHTGERPFQCVECGKGFASKRSLRNHSHGGRNARDRPHICTQCTASFTTAFMLKTHEKSHTGERPFVCTECGKSYRSQHVYQDHLNHHKGIKAHKCKECGNSFTWRTSLWAHMREHAKDKPFECVQCRAMFAERSELKDHWEVHLDDKPHQCAECGIGFMHEADCDKHIEIHKQSPSHSCSICDQKFTWADELNRHMQIHKEKEKKKSLCTNCGQTFTSKGHLKVHMLIHTGVKPFECETCHKRFYTRSLLRKHTVFHSNERPFECALCGDKFPTQGILRSHIRTHTGERPYSCKDCGKSFPQSTYLKRHALTHTGERPYPCLDCDSAFVSRYDLKIHMRTHTGERPFACDECEERFYERAQLTAHIRTHTGERPFVCDLCGKGFNSSSHIKKHFNRVHPDAAPFYCTDCGERFMMCEALRKHRKCTHLTGTEVFPELVQVTETDTEEQSMESTLEDQKDPLNRLIEDSQILDDEASNHSCDPVNEDSPKILTQQFEIVQVNLVDSSQLIKLSDGYRCETVEVYHAESLADFEENSDYEAESVTSIPEQAD